MMNDSIELDDIDEAGSFDDSLTLCSKCHSKVLRTDQQSVEAFMKYFVEELKLGVVIPPCDFQDWLHPELKLNYTEPAEGYPIGWLRMK